LQWFFIGGTCRMPRNGNGKSRKKSMLHRATSAVKRLFLRGRFLDDSAPEEVQQTQPRAPKPQPKAAKYPQRETDIPLDLIERAYTPPMTSSKASFRSDGADHQLDQEFAFGRADSEWNDEDRFTNKSGDPRIGTHRRSYEPAVETRDEERE
jgi:hypothetical protein